MTRSVSSRGSLCSGRDRPTQSYNTGRRVRCLGHRSRASVKDVWFEEPQTQGPAHSRFLVWQIVLLLLS